ncbi:signal peptidase I [Xiamenia xianingshaonis]|uniref:Signal peptidase I n=1 Tax=Xiamenia xianingshaonis TaxID=2682776 RepID=A0A9E6SUJ7_9ACTN|nr:signal peptidase I [Xiamenia xianingshaonis]NHM14657.1 signal peptidase I [Xiamenia xianingshaonis]QTU84307.1 signal peptidase I [Xiamenia xianingshaonis]
MSELGEAEGVAAGGTQAAAPAGGRTRGLPKGKGYLRWMPAALRAIGFAMLLLAIVVLVPTAVPRVLGMDTFAIQTASMAPTMPVGSLVLVQPVDAADIPEGEAAAFHRGDSVVVHRVITNQVVEGYLVTKGDANQLEDQEPVPYPDVIGQVTYTIPYLGAFGEILSTVTGKIYFALFIVAALLVIILANQQTAQRRYLTRS